MIDRRRVAALLLGGVAIVALTPGTAPGQYVTDEVKVVQVLRQIHTAQVVFKMFACMNDDQDNLGEYGSLGELSGLVTTNLRGGVAPVWFPNPPLLGPMYQSIDVNGVLNLFGYQFMIYLPDAGGYGVGELPWGGPGAGVGADSAEQVWCCYAWSATLTSTATTFLITQNGLITQTGHDAVLYYASPPLSIDGYISSNMFGTQAFGVVPISNDGNTWMQLAVAELDLLGAPSIGSIAAFQVTAPTYNVPFALAFSASSAVGIQLLDGRVIPLDPDPVLSWSLTTPNPFIANQYGMIDSLGNGTSTPAMQIPPNPALVGLTIYAAAITTGSPRASGVGTISPAYALTIVP